MAKAMMTQCRLERATATGVEVQVSWIESRFASEGRAVDLKEGGEWSRGWKVAHVGSTQDASVVQARERDFAKHRQATDV